MNAKTGKKLTYNDFQVGYRGTFTKKITEEANKQFADVVEDYNPVHFDKERMAKSIFGQRATNGFLTESTIGTALVHMFTSDQTIIIALKKSIKLMAPVFMGDTVTATVTVKERFPEKRRLLCECKVRKEDGTVVVDAEFLIKILEGI
jgi:3-hydroxybutyryl-CoA dehydratase